MRILFCGGGALGSHALYIGRDLAAELSVVDFDRVETKNLVSQWFVKQFVGKNKAQALSMQLKNFFGVALKDYSVKLESTNVETLLGDKDLIVDCFDNAASRILVQDFARAKNIACVHAGLAADGAFGAVRWDRDFVIDAEDTPAQATCEGEGFLPIITMVSAALVASIRGWMADQSERNWNVTPGRSEGF